MKKLEMKMAKVTKRRRRRSDKLPLAARAGGGIRGPPPDIFKIWMLPLAV